MADFRLPKNSVVKKGKEHKADPGATNVKKFKIYRYDPDSGENPRYDSFEVDLDECIGSGACVRACPEKEILAITDGRARLLNPLSCVGHSACMQACPVGAIKLVFGTATRGVELPRLTPSFETSQNGIFVIGELSGIGLIRNAVEQGRQAAATIARSGRRGRPTSGGAARSRDLSNCAMADPAPPSKRSPTESWKKK